MVDPTDPSGNPDSRAATERTRRWYDRLSPWYDRFIDPFESSVRAAGVELLAPQPGALVLDIGCGTGVALADLSMAVGPEGMAIGLDLSAEMCDRTRRRLDEGQLQHAGVVMGDARSLPFADGTVDAAFASFVLDLFAEAELSLVVREWRRILGPDGALVVVALSDRTSGPTVRAYKRLHRRFPTKLDCRPIPVVETIHAGGFRVEQRLKRSIAGMPIDVVRALPG